jgi:hypothetical protein
MNINSHRGWITPLVIGSFLLSAVTGTLMFFHLDMGFNKLAHEWLSWLLLTAVVLHILYNLPAFTRYFGQTTARYVILALAIVLGLSFFSFGGKKPEPAFATPVRALGQAPLPLLAQIAGVSLPELKQRLEAAGVHAESDTATLRDLVGADLRTQLGVLREILPKPQASPDAAAK